MSQRKASQPARGSKAAKKSQPKATASPKPQPAARPAKAEPTDPRNPYPFKADPKNIRLHTESGNAMIDQSLEEVGPFRSIGVDGQGIVRAGNGVYEAAKRKGIKLKPVTAGPNELVVVIRPDLTGVQAERAAFYDNRAGELSIWNVDAMSRIAADQPGKLQGIFDPNQIAQYAKLRQLSEDTGPQVPLLGGPAPLGQGDDPGAASGGFAEGSQFSISGYVCVIRLTEDQNNNSELKEAIAALCDKFGLTFKIGKL